MRKRDLAVFLLYVALTASTWMVQLAYASVPPPIYPEALALAIALVCFGLPRHSRSGVSRPRIAQALLSGLLLFGLPRVLFAAFARGFPQPTQVVFLALVPVAVVLIQSFHETDTDFTSLLAASLAGVAGLVLVVPTDLAISLREPSSAIFFSVGIVSIAIGSYLGYVAARDLPRRLSVVLMLSPGILLAGLQAVIAHATIRLPDAGGLLNTALAATQLVFIAYLVGSVSPVAFSARYLLIPLTTTLEGLVYLRPAITWRLIAGLLAMLFGAAKLLIQEDCRRRDSGMLLL